MSRRGPDLPPTLVEDPRYPGVVRYIGHTRVRRPTPPDLPPPRGRHSARWQRMARLRRWYAAVVVWGRWPVVLLWGAAVVMTAMWLPGLSQAGGSGFAGFTQSNSRAIQAEADSIRAFAFPVITRVMVVQHDPAGLSQATQRAVVDRALAIDQHKPQFADMGRRTLAVPLVNAGNQGLRVGHGRPGTTAVTILGFDPRVGFDDQVAMAHRFVAKHTTPADHVVGVTGLYASRLAQLHYITDNLTLLEICTIAAVLIVVGLRFRSIVAPLVTAVAAAVSYAVMAHVVAWYGEQSGQPIPDDLEPLLIALVLGVVTDYTIFYLAGMQDRLGHGDGRLSAARIATAEFTPIVLTAGLTVSATVLSLLAAKLGFFRVFGPAMAITVGVAVAVSVTLIPALLAILGRVTYWPGRPKPLAPVEADDPAAGPLDPRTLGWRGSFARFLTVRPVAVVVVLGCLAAAYFAAAPARHMRLELGVTTTVPASDVTRRAAVALGDGFPRGLLSPTVVLVRKQGVGNDLNRLAALERGIGRVKGVAAVIGPTQQQATARYGAVVSKDRSAARYIVLFDAFPTTADAVASLQRLEDAIPGMARTAGLSDARIAYAGDTALTQEATDATTGSLRRIAIVAFAIDFILLALFLRALVAPLYLLVTNTLAMLMALGITTWVFQDLLHYDGLIFYVPFAAFVLLLALGSDYNIFAVGSVWDEARNRNLRDAIAYAVPRSTSAITAAGFALAISFGLLAVVPLSPFRQLGTVLGVGIILDAFVVRSLLVPALLGLFGRASGWPGKSLTRGDTAAAERVASAG
jgi:putative drug exporter of the RND superfamily